MSSHLFSAEQLTELNRTEEGRQETGERGLEKEDGRRETRDERIEEEDRREAEERNRRQKKGDTKMGLGEGR